MSGRDCDCEWRSPPSPVRSQRSSLARRHALRPCTPSPGADPAGPAIAGGLPQHWVRSNRSASARRLRQQDAGVLKVGATPQMIDGVFATFLHRYAERYPGVQIKLAEAVGPALVAMLERGDLHRHRLAAADPGRRRSLRHAPLPPDGFLAACHASLPLANTGNLEISRLRAICCCSWDPASSCAARSMPPAAWPASGPPSSPRAAAAHPAPPLAEAGHGVAIVPSVSSHAPLSASGFFALRTTAGRCGCRWPAPWSSDARVLATPMTSACRSRPTCGGRATDFMLIASAPSW